MHLFECEATFEADPAQVWKVWTDVERWPQWDVSKEIARLDGPFGPGACGWAKQRGNLGGPFTITVVEDGRRWVTECPIPLGKVVFDHVLEPAAGGQVRVVKSVEVYGGFGSLLRLIAPKMRRDITQSLAALERQLSALRTRTHGHQAQIPLAARPPPGRLSGTERSRFLIVPGPAHYRPHDHRRRPGRRRTY
jgi:hypothetical protein